MQPTPHSWNGYLETKSSPLVLRAFDGELPFDHNHAMAHVGHSAFLFSLLFSRPLPLSEITIVRRGISNRSGCRDHRKEEAG